MCHSSVGCSNGETKFTNAVSVLCAAVDESSRDSVCASVGRPVAAVVVSFAVSVVSQCETDRGPVAAERVAIAGAVLSVAVSVLCAAVDESSRDSVCASVGRPVAAVGVSFAVSVLSVAVAVVFSCYYSVSTVPRTSGWLRRMSVLSRWKPLSGMCHSADG